MKDPLWGNNPNFAKNVPR